jgi:hypothetical protein
MGEELTIIEVNNLTELEATIEKNLKSFYEVGFALMQIRDNKLYRQTFTTFEGYCKEKWGMNRDYANKLIRSSEVINNLDTTVSISERALRPLTKIKDPEEQRRVWGVSLETAPDGKVTAQHVETTIEKLFGLPEKQETDEDSETLYYLKRQWKLATKKDRKKFLLWIKEEN